MISFQKNNVIVFFGGTETSGVDLQKKYYGIEFLKLKQTHSDVVVEASDHLIEADAHYTSSANKGLLILTADCMPIMIYCGQTKRVAAVHAGWRGVESKIVEKTLNKLISSGSTQKSFEFWVGPHILKKSFEVDADVFHRLSLAQYNLKPEEYSNRLGNKYYVDLKKIVFSQISQILGSEPNHNFFDVDTATDTDYYSFRRDRTKERNISFICLLNSDS